MITCGVAMFSYIQYVFLFDVFISWLIAGRAVIMKAPQRPDTAMTALIAASQLIL
jgi:hypothetical protein